MAFAQSIDTSLIKIKNTEKEIQSLCKIAFYSKNETLRNTANTSIVAAWNKIIALPEVLDYPFDSLKKDISILENEAKNLKIITWNIFTNEGTYNYFGFVCHKSFTKIKTGFLRRKKIECYQFYPLIDKSETIKSPEAFVGTANKWFGMLYYKMIECNSFITLLAYDPNDKLIQRKFVDVLFFKSNGEPVFGKDVFKFSRKNPRRLMFEYGSSITMSLRYDENNHRIVYSHLSAKQEGNLLEGQFQYYGPDGSFDALEFKKDKWVTVEDIDARNQQAEYDKKKKPNPKKQKAIYKPKK
jgi:hypothetical protein